MKMFNKILGCSTVAAAFLISASTIQAQNLINGGFEVAVPQTPNPITVAGVDQGWTTFNGAGSASQSDMSSSAYSPLNGTFALLETTGPGNNWNPAGAYQIISGITPGQTYTFNIWALTDTVDTAPNGLLFQLGFETSALGGISTVENPGNTVNINGLVPTIGVWTKYSVTATAPAGYTDAIVYAMFQDNNSAIATENMFYDNSSLTLTPTPEPSTLVLAGLGGISALSLIRRRKN